VENKAEQPINGIRSSSNFSRLRVLFHREAPGATLANCIPAPFQPFGQFRPVRIGGFGLPGAGGSENTANWRSNVGNQSPHANWVAGHGVCSLCRYSVDVLERERLDLPESGRQLLRAGRSGVAGGA